MARVIDLNKFSKEIGNLLPDQEKKLRKAVVNAVAQSIPELVKASPVDTGQYAASWDFTVEENSVILGNYAPHAPIIEYGARPFTPPIGPLLAWAKRVLQDPSQPPNYSDRVWSLAKHTQAKIAKFGMQPRHVMEKEIPAIIKRIREEIRKL
jgi:hypothetical protein